MGAELGKGLLLYPILFVIFMAMISKHGRGEERFRFADDMVLSSSSYRNLQHALRQLIVK